MARYKPNTDLDRRTEEAGRETEENYVQMLEESGDGAWIENVFVDLKELVDRRFACCTRKCLARGARKVSGLSCCAHFDVSVSPRERDRILAMPGLLEFLRDRKPGMKRSGLQEFFFRDENYALTLEKDPAGNCAFGYFDEEGEFFCGIHALALKRNLDVRRYKPAVCQLFPLSYVELPEDRYLLSAITESSAAAVLEDPDDYQPISCITKRWPGDPPLYIGMRSAIVSLFGEVFFRRLDDLARKRLVQRQEHGKAKNA